MRLGASLFEGLARAREQMGAPLLEVREARPMDPVGERLADEGIPVDLGQVSFGPEGEILYAGRSVLLYIQDTGVTRETLLNAPELTKKYHLRQCRTLTDMHAKGRFARYVVSRRTDGRFLAHWRDREASGEEWARLLPCRNCLRELDFEGAPGNFSIADHFAGTNGSSFARVPRVADTDGRSSEYTSNWNEVSRRARQRADWRCASCSAHLHEHPELLHTHHRDGVRSNNAPANLVALCKLCHADEHGHMSVPHGERRIIEAARRTGEHEG